MVSSDEKQVVATMVSSALRELFDSMHVLCGRLQDAAAPLEQDEYDRLAVLIPSMLGSAEQLCQVAERSLADSDCATRHGSRDQTTYGALARSLAETRRLAKIMLSQFRPQIPEHEEAIGVIDRLMELSRIEGGHTS